MAARWYVLTRLWSLPLKAELIDEQTEKLIKLAEKHNIDYDGWGTYFESGEDDDEEIEGEGEE